MDLEKVGGIGLLVIGVILLAFAISVNQLFGLDLEIMLTNCAFVFFLLLVIGGTSSYRK